MTYIQNTPQGNIVLGISCQNVTFVIQDMVLFDSRISCKPKSYKQIKSFTKKQRCCTIITIIPYSSDSFSSSYSAPIMIWFYSH